MRLKFIFKAWFLCVFANLWHFFLFFVEQNEREIDILGGRPGMIQGGGRDRRFSPYKSRKIHSLASLPLSAHVRFVLSCSVQRAMLPGWSQILSGQTQL